MHADQLPMNQVFGPKPKYDVELNKQIEVSRAKGEGDLAKLFNTGETWTVT